MSATCALSCAKCKATNSPYAQFCGNCGLVLAAPARTDLPYVLLPCILFVHFVASSTSLSSWGRSNSWQWHVYNSLQRYYYYNKCVLRWLTLGLREPKIFRRVGLAAWLLLFNAIIVYLWMLIGWQKGRLVCKNPMLLIPKGYFLETSGVRKPSGTGEIQFTWKSAVKTEVAFSP